MIMFSVKVDTSNIQHADDGSTTYYGGFIKINDLEYQCHGNDREIYGWQQKVEELVMDMWSKFYGGLEIPADEWCLEGVDFDSPESFILSVSTDLRITIDPIQE